MTSCTWTQVVRARRVMLELVGDQNFPTSVAFVHLFLYYSILRVCNPSIKFCSLCAPHIFSRLLQRSSKHYVKGNTENMQKTHRLPGTSSTSCRDTVLLRWEALKNRVDCQTKRVFAAALAVTGDCNTCNM